MRKAFKALAVLMVMAPAACTPMDDAMVAIFGRSMRDQASFDPYENPLPPAEGAVSFSSGNFYADFGSANIAGPEENDILIPDFTMAQTSQPANPIWESFENPLEATPDVLARGEMMYNRNCAVCHGADGYGANASIASVHPTLLAFNLADGAAVDHTDAYIYGMIRVGRGLMPSYGHAVTHWDRWAIVNYVRQLQANAAGGDE